jgi:hypothetical protein
VAQRFLSPYNGKKFYETVGKKKEEPRVWFSGAETLPLFQKFRTNLNFHSDEVGVLLDLSGGKETPRCPLGVRSCFNVDFRFAIPMIGTFLCELPSSE